MGSWARDDCYYRHERPESDNNKHPRRVKDLLVVMSRTVATAHTSMYMSLKIHASLGAAHPLPSYVGYS